MKDVYSTIYKTINPIVNSYKNHYPNKKEYVYPYAEIKIPNILPNNEVSNNYLLEIDVWDNKGDNVTEIETIAENIYNALIDQHIKMDDAFIAINRNSPCIIALPDPEIDIQRRQIRFILTVYRPNMNL